MAGGVVGVMASVAGAFLFHQFYLVPLHERDLGIQNAREEVEERSKQFARIRAELPRLERFRQLSLPADVDLARREYENYLNDLLRDSGVDATVTPKSLETRTESKAAGKKLPYTRLTFTVLGHGTLESVVKFMEQFHGTGLLQQIKLISLQRPLTTGAQERPNELDVNLTVEALVVAGAARRPSLLPNIDPRVLIAATVGFGQGPGGLALVGWAAGPSGPLGPGTLARTSGSYLALAKKDIFFGRPPSRETPGGEVEVSRFLYLTDITQAGKKSEAFLYDRLNNRKTRLRSSPGFDSFRVMDGDKTVVQGKVVRIDARDVVFHAGGKYYSLHVGQSLEEAMERPVPQPVSLTRKDAGR